MAVSYETLRNYSVPAVEHELTPRAAAFYALSIGFGQDPMNESEFAFVDPDLSIVPVPSMALVLGYPGFWLGEAEAGLNAARIVHVEQEVILHGALPVTGKVVGKTRVTGLFNRGENKGLVLTSERDLLTVEGGVRVATLRQTHFLLGDRCDEAPAFPAASPVSVPDEPPLAEIEVWTRPEQALFYRLNGDMNRLHIDPAVARQAGFARPILHGMCTFGIVTRAVLATVCGYRAAEVRGIAMRFRAPVYPGEALRVKIWAGGALQVSAIGRDAVVIDAGSVTFVEDATRQIRESS